MLCHGNHNRLVLSTHLSFIILIKWWLDGEQVGAHQHPTWAQLCTGITRIVVGTSVVPTAFVAVDSLVQTRFSFASKLKIGPSPYAHAFNVLRMLQVWLLKHLTVATTIDKICMKVNLILPLQQLYRTKQEQNHPVFLARNIFLSMYKGWKMSYSITIFMVVKFIC